MGDLPAEHLGHAGSHRLAVGVGGVAPGGLVNVAEGVTEVQQAAGAVVPLVGGDAAGLYPAAGGNEPFRIGTRRFLQIVQQGGVRDAGALDDLRHTGGQLTGRQCGQTRRVGQHKGGLPECAQLVFALRQIQSGLAADGTVRLRQQGGGDMGQRYAPQQCGGGKARQIAAGAAAQRHYAAGAVKVAAQDAAAQLSIDGQGLSALTGGDGVQRRVQSGCAETVQHRITVQLGGVLIGHHRPAGDGGRTSQQSAGLR